nr:zinc ribbon domain-containing protein [uncultured Cellulosilyticum sp.]
MSRACINCGEALADEDKYCPLCGTFNPLQEMKATNQYNGGPYQEAQYDPFKAGMVHQAIKEKKSHNKAWIILTLGVIAIMAFYRINERKIEIKRANVPPAQINLVTGEVGKIIETEDFDFIIKEAVDIQNESINNILPEGKKIVVVKASADNLKDSKIFEESPDIYGIYDGDHYVEPLSDYEVTDILEKIGYKMFYLRDLKYDGNTSGYLMYVVNEDVAEITLAYSELNISSTRGNTIGKTYEVTVPIGD